MDHPNAVRFRTAFDDLWERGELDPTTRLLRDDVVWVNDIGAGPFHRGAGKESVLTLFAEWTALFDGGFAHELVDICASDHNVVEILHEVGTARGQRFDNLALYRYELDDKRIAARDDELEEPRHDAHFMHEGFRPDQYKPR